METKKNIFKQSKTGPDDKKKEKEKTEESDGRATSRQNGVLATSNVPIPFENYLFKNQRSKMFMESLIIIPWVQLVKAS